MVTLPTILWICVACIWANAHARKIKQGVEPGSIQDTLLRVFIGWAFAMAIAWNIEYPTGLYIFILALIYLFGLFWLTFDLALNYYRGLPLLYCSEWNGKLLDRIFNGNGLLQLIVKLFIIISSLCALLIVL